MKSKITQRFLQSFQLIPSIFFIFTLGFVTGCESENRGVIFTVSTASSSGLGTLDFGNVQLGKTSARKIVFMAQTVKQKAATILSVTASDPAINLYKEDVTHTGFDHTYNVSFSPTALGPFNAKIVITAKDDTGEKASTTIAVMGQGIEADAPLLAISESVVSFDNITVSQSAARHVVVSNTGTLPLVLNASLQDDILTSLLGNYSFSSTDAAHRFSQNITIAPQESAMLEINSTATGAGLYNGTLTLTSNGGAATVALVSHGIDGAILNVATDTLRFNDLYLNNDTGRVTGNAILPITNLGTRRLVISSAAITSLPFELVNNVSVIEPGETRNLEISITADSMGTYASSLLIQSNGGVATVRITADVLSPVISVSQTSVDFGTVSLGRTATRQIHLRNIGNTPFNLVGADFSSLTSGFNIQADLPPSIAPGESATIDILFTPSLVGSYTDSLTLNADMGASVTIRLIGECVSAGSLEANTSYLDFGNLELPTGQQAAASLPIQFRNPGTQIIRIIDTTITGTGFSIIGSQFTSLSPGGAGILMIRFSTTTAGLYSGLLTVTTSVGTLNIMLAANAQTPAITVTNRIEFGLQSPGTTTTMPLEFTNTGSSTIHISSIRLYGGHAFVLGEIPFTELLAGETRTVGVTFTPVATGYQSSLLSVWTEAGETLVSIDGTGTGFSPVSASPSLVRYINTRLGLGSIVTVTVTNNHTIAANIVEIRSSEDALRVQGLTSTVLNPGASATFRLEWYPTALGYLNGNITIDTTVGSVVVYATGNAVP